ncbi:YjcZ family sporulation protein [Bacillus sp. Xin]|nr:YjcZ family sporulation protein [Bacillus sp. Xin]MBC6973065.1 YjcZ family sporulation protein [Bacillus sp. Xin]
MLFILLIIIGATCFY